MDLSDASGKKSPVTRPGTEPGTFRLVAQRLNHHSTPGPKITSFYKIMNGSCYLRDPTFHRANCRVTQDEKLCCTARHFLTLPTSVRQPSHEFCSTSPGCPCIFRSLCLVPEVLVNKIFNFLMYIVARFQNRPFHFIKHGGVYTARLNSRHTASCLPLLLCDCFPVRSC